MKIKSQLLIGLIILTMVGAISRTAFADKSGSVIESAPQSIESSASAARPASVGTAFTYQGQLSQSDGAPLNGRYNFRFTLFNALTSGNTIGSINTISNVLVTDGLFSLELDFGAVFDGSERWIEIGVTSAELSSAYTTLAPRQPIRPAPYAIYSEQSGSGGNTSNGVVIVDAPGDGISICATGAQPCESGSLDPTRHHGIEIVRTTHDGVYVYDAGDDGVHIRRSSQHGLLVESSGFDGLSICATGGANCATSYDVANGNSGVEIHSAADDGIQVIRAGRYGIWVQEATTKAARFDGDVLVNGIVETASVTVTSGADLAEHFALSDETFAEPGMVVAIDAENPGHLRLAESAYDRKVAGVISGAGGIQPGISIGQAGSLSYGDHQVALAGTVYVWADASSGSIAPGDLLTTSALKGHAMKVADYTLAQGAILGKAMSSLDEGTGLVLVLVTLQ